MRPGRIRRPRQGLQFAWGKIALVPANPSFRNRLIALAGLTLSVALLVPGLFLPVITIRGALQPAGLAELAPQLLEQGISDQTLARLRPLLNPTALAFMDS